MIKVKMSQRRHHRTSHIGGTRLADVQREHKDFQADFTLIYDQFKESLAGGSLLTVAAQANSQPNLVPLIMAAIRLVEKLASDDKGVSKKSLVMALLTRIIADSAMHEQEKVLIQVMLESLGPSIIDGLIDADHGRLLSHGLAKLREKCGCVSN